MKTYEIEVKLKELQSMYHDTAKAEIKATLKIISERDIEAYDTEEDAEEDIRFRQRQHLIDLISNNTATWSGGTASITNMLESQTREIAITLLTDLNRGFLSL